jgi:hypothetical protein
MGEIRLRSAVMPIMCVHKDLNIIHTSKVVENLECLHHLLLQRLEIC